MRLFGEHYSVSISKCSIHGFSCIKHCIMIRKDFLPHYVTCNFKKEELNSEKQKQTLYKNSSNAVRAFEVLDDLRK